MSKSYFNILFKTFVKGFFKTHSGLLMFLFVTFLSYFFYIEVLKDNLLSLEERNKNHLLLVLNVVSSPALALLVLGMFLIYSWKSYGYVIKQIKATPHFFLFYSANALNKSTQFGSLFLAQLSIVSPILFYALFSIFIGFIYGFYALPLANLAIVLITSAIVAFLYLIALNTPIKNQQVSVIIQYLKFVPKPLFSLFSFHTIADLKVVFIVSKVLSMGLSIGLFYLLNDFRTNQLNQIIGIVLGLSNAVLIFEHYSFEKNHFKLSLNLPKSTLQIYSNWVLCCIVLISPEILMLFLIKSALSTLTITLEAIGILVLFRSILLLHTVEMKQYLYFIFGFFIISILLIQFQLFAIAIVLGYFLAFYLVKRWYFRPEY